MAARVYEINTDRLGEGPASREMQEQEREPARGRTISYDEAAMRAWASPQAQIRRPSDTSQFGTQSLQRRATAGEQQPGVLPARRSKIVRGLMNLLCCGLLDG
ncbi:hypothetical protein BD779DRAFT_1466154 [Infundibulicybe gibba]|nr:hypothetical protein BD779DRAFT_1466154 [Infundibulicybe gibba]